MNETPADPPPDPAPPPAPAPRGPACPWNLRDVLGVFVAFIVIQVGLGLLVRMLAEPIILSDEPQLEFDERALERRILAIAAGPGTVAGHAVAIWLVWRMALIRGGDRGPAVLLGAAVRPVSVAVAGLAGATLAALFVSGGPAGALPGPLQAAFLESGGWGVAWLSVMLLAAAPAGEELLYRGCLFPAVRAALRPVAAVAAATAVCVAPQIAILPFLPGFGAAAAVPVLAQTLLLTGIRAATGSTVAALGAHVGFNAVVLAGLLHE